MKKKTTNEFIYEAKIKHNNKYDYSLVNYKGNKIKVKIICPIHGEFEQRPNDHLNTNGCSACGGVKKHTKETFIKKAAKIHNYKYDYSLTCYNNNNKSYIKIICPIHGIFDQKAIIHINGCGCPKCGIYIYIAMSRRCNHEILFLLMFLCNDTEFDYDLYKIFNGNKIRFPEYFNDVLYKVIQSFEQKIILKKHFKK